MFELEYLVIWRREGQAKKRAIYQTRAGAIQCAERQVTAQGEVTWLDEPIPAIVYGPVIEQREVQEWVPSESTEAIRA